MKDKNYGYEKHETKNRSTQKKKLEEENRELGKLIGEKSSQLREEYKKNTGGIDGHQMPARGN